MIADKHITVIIPALNESQSIGRVLADIPDIVDDVIVVDNGSDDNTDTIARSLGATVVYEKNKGYGAACLAGIRALGQTGRAKRADLVAFIDGDYSDYPEDLLAVVRPVAEGRCQFAIGCRQNTATNYADVPFHQRWGNWLACGFIDLLHGYKYSDLGPMRCISLKLLARLQMSDADYGWTTEMQLKASILGVAILQVPVRYRRRIGKSKISGTLTGSLMAGYKIFYWAIRLFLHNHKATHKTFNSGPM